MADSKRITDKTPGAVADVAEKSNGAAVKQPQVGPESEQKPVRAKKAPLGAKEIPAFQWKLLGTADYATLTLFKAVEREDAEAQLERVRRDGYYQDLKIIDIDAKVQQPKQPASVRKQQAAKAKKEATAAKKAAQKKGKKKKTPRASGTIKVSLKKANEKAAAKKAAAKQAAAQKAAAKKAAAKKAATKKTTSKKAATKKATAKKKAAKKTPAKKAAPAKKSAAKKKAAPRKSTTKKAAKKKRK